MQRYTIPGADFIDNMRRNLTSLELAFSGGEKPDALELNRLLVSIDENREYLEGAINEEIATADREPVGLY